MAAWEFVSREKPSFSLTAINPPVVFGPVASSLSSLGALNTSNQRIRDFITGIAKDSCPPTGVYLHVDVRDLALAHVLAFEKPRAGGKRILTVSGLYSNKEIVEIIEKRFPEFRSCLPLGKALATGDYPESGVYQFDNSLAQEILGIRFRSLEESIVDTVHSMMPLEQRLCDC